MNLILFSTIIFVVARIGHFAKEVKVIHILVDIARFQVLYMQLYTHILIGQLEFNVYQNGNN